MAADGERGGGIGAFGVGAGIVAFALDEATSGFGGAGGGGVGSGFEGAMDRGGFEFVFDMVLAPEVAFFVCWTGGDTGIMAIK